MNKEIFDQKTEIFKEDVPLIEQTKIENLYKQYLQHKENLDHSIKKLNKLANQSKDDYFPEFWHALNETQEIESTTKDSLLKFLRQGIKSLRKEVNIVEDFEIDKNFCKQIFESTIVFESALEYKKFRSSTSPSLTRKLLVRCGFKYSESDLSKFEKTQHLTEDHSKKLHKEIAHYSKNKEDDGYTL